ncbi:hypothetical protein ACLVWU_17955 [Bdellovibrio sp. HCB290]|uniref:hypothetical protein n=1 Tax=Bdellovibrio sp. HCB290 TaxID=3394356 RepID=UPI0039B41F80
MYSNTKTKKNTGVQLVCTLVISTLISIQAGAETRSSSSSSNSSSNSNSNSSSSNNNNNNNSNSNNNGNNGFGGGNYSNYSQALECRDYRNQYQDAKRDLSKLCRDAGAGSGCADKVAACSGDAGDDGQLDMYSLGATALGSDNALGSALGIMGQGRASGCPQYSYQDYFDKKDKYTDDLDKTEEDLAKLSDDQADVQEDFNKEISDLQEDLNKAQEDLQGKKRDLADKEREQISSYQKINSDSEESLEELGTQLLDLNGKKITAERDRSLQLIGMTEASAKRACTKAVVDQKAVMAKDASLSGLSSGTMISKAKKQKQDLIAIWNDCMEVYQQKRQALMESKNQEMQLLEDNIKKVQNKMTRIDDALTLAQSQLDQIKAQAKTEGEQADQNMTKLMQNIQNKMTAAKQKLDQKLQTIAKKTETYGEKTKRLNAQISQLGVAPPSGATTTASAISGEMADKQQEIEELQDYVETACGGGTEIKNRNSESQGGRS